MKQSLILWCSGDCGKSISARFPIKLDPLTKFLRKRDWFVSALSPLEQKSDMDFGVTCSDCAERLMPGVPKIAKEKMDG